MPHNIIRSAGHAFRGLVTAFATERNLTFFAFGYAAVLLLGFSFSLHAGDWLALILSGGLFFSIELLNTSLEWLTDGLDDHLKAGHQTENFPAIKTAKDIAAAASLVSLVVVIAVILFVFTPYFA